MPKLKADAAFHMFNVVARDWPADPGHVVRIAKLLKLLDCVPILFRSKNRNEVSAGDFIAGSVIASYAVTHRWGKVVEILNFFGRMDEVFDHQDVRHWATATKWQFKRGIVDFPERWRPKISSALEGRFFKNHVHRTLEGFWEKHCRERPAVAAPMGKRWKQCRMLNIPFDMAGEFDKASSRNPKHCSDLAVRLNMLSWIANLLMSRYRKDVLAGCFNLTVQVGVHAQAGEWKRFIEILETVGRLEDKFDDDFVYFCATATKACYTHHRSLNEIPRKHRDRVRESFELPFFQNHFDADHFEIEMRARDLHTTRGPASP